MAAAIPFALQAGAAIYSHYKNKKPQAAQNAALQGTQQAGEQTAAAAPPLLKTGQQLTGQGQGYLQQAGNYYGSILSNRQAASESLAPERSTALDYYKGAEQKTARTMRGGARDTAMAELERQKVGQFANMLPAARAMAAQGSERVGGAALSGGAAASGQGVNAAANAGYINTGLFNQAQQVKQNNADSGSAWAKLLGSGLSAILNRTSGGGGNSLYGPSGYGSAGE